MNSRERNLLIAILWLVAAASFIISCAASGTGSALSYTPPSGGGTPTPTPENETGTAPGATPVPGSYTMSVTAEFPTSVYNVLHTSTNWNSPCSVTVTGGTPAVTASCLLEVEEFDLAANDWKLNWSAPVGGCPYTVVQPYWFMQWAGGAGATEISYTTVGGSIDPGSLAQAAPVGPLLFEVVDNKIKCIYDHTDKTPTSKNACSGKYVETKTAIVGTGTTVTVTAGAWGGKIGNAAAGPAADESWYRGGTNNLPGYMYYSTYAGGSGSISISKMLPDLISNIYSENYQANPSMAPAMLLDYGNPYYTFYCMDGAQEILGKIELMVRGWNQASELAKGSLGVADTTGNQAGDLVNDRNNIDDLKNDAVTYPDEYPEDRL